MQLLGLKTQPTPGVFMNQEELKKCRTLAEVVQFRAQYQPHKVCCTFLNKDIASPITYAELDQHAKAIASCLHQQGIKPGDRVLLLFSPGLLFIQAFIACNYAGCIAVPIYPPIQNKIMDKALRIIANCKPSIVLMAKEHLKLCDYTDGTIPYFSNIPCYAIDDIDLIESHRWQPPTIDKNQVAFLQYTSGSTMHPKGVMVGHHNLLDNLERIYDVYHMSDETVLFSWLPPQHDMGLIGGILSPIYGGFPVILMSSFAFLQNPLSWLQNITKFKVTCSPSPNFAYDYCVKRIKEEKKQGLDLSSWDVASNGAEPIRKETLDHFYHAFKAYGFRKEAFYPCYGLAETTLIVSGATPLANYRSLILAKDEYRDHRVHFASETDPESYHLVGCGHPVLTVRIVNPKTLTLCEVGNVGEIWVHGDSVAQGYWEQPEETEYAFHALIKDDPSQKNYLRTGDLGFMHEGELYVTGRIKDLIILYGKNHYPQDIEYSLNQSSIQNQLGKCAAFVIQKNHEYKLILMCEVKDQWMHSEKQEELFTSIFKIVYQIHQLEIDTIVFIPLKSLPLTTSGKIRRNFCRQHLVEKTLPIVATWELNKIRGKNETVSL
jgi:acyl-CoA synthetase (AMP-forming)/AMP-acid ligase II